MSNSNPTGENRYPQDEKNIHKQGQGGQSGSAQSGSHQKTGGSSHGGSSSQTGGKSGPGSSDDAGRSSSGQGSGKRQPGSFTDDPDKARDAGRKGGKS
jgi:uncharacterized protein